MENIERFKEYAQRAYENAEVDYEIKEAMKEKIRKAALCRRSALLMFARVGTNFFSGRNFGHGANIINGTRASRGFK